MFFAHREREGERERDSFYARSFTTLKLTEGFAACEKKAPAICPILKNYPMQRRNDVIGQSWPVDWRASKKRSNIFSG